MRKVFLTCILFVSQSAWVGAADEDQLSRGKELYDDWCVICHDVNDPSSGGGTQALRELYKGAVPAILHERTDLAAELITLLVREGRSGMPNFRYTEISKSQLADIIAYLQRNNK
jgi:mono/diheme cytochrome c family protein